MALNINGTWTTNSGSHIERTWSTATVGTYVLEAYSWDSYGVQSTKYVANIDVAYDLISGLLLRYAINEGTGAAQLADSSGNNVNMTLAGLTADYTWSTRSIIAGGSTPYIAIANAKKAASTSTMVGNLNGQSTGTIAAWVSYSSATTPAFFATSSGLGNNECQLIHVSNKLRWSVGNSAAGGWDYYETGAILTASTWYHVAVTYDGATLKIYVNGVERTITPVGGGRKWFANSFGAGGNRYIGIGCLPRSGVNTTAAANSKVDEVRVYSRALNANEINALMNNY